MGSCKATVLSKWIRWILVKKITSRILDVSQGTCPPLYCYFVLRFTDLCRPCKGITEPVHTLLCKEDTVPSAVGTLMSLLPLCLESHCAFCIQGSPQVMRSSFFRSKWWVTVEIFQCLKAKKWSKFKTKIKMHICFTL